MERKNDKVRLAFYPHATTKKPANDTRILLNDETKDDKKRRRKKQTLTHSLTHSHSRTHARTHAHTHAHTHTRPVAKNNFSYFVLVLLTKQGRDKVLEEAFKT
jgi:hypothetical protein